MPYTIARAICIHDYDMFPLSHGGTDFPSSSMDIPSFMIQKSVCHAIVMEVPQDYNASSIVPCLFIHSNYVIPCLYIRSLSVMLSRIFFHVLYGRSFKILCLLNYALMKRHDYDITVFFTKRGVTCVAWSCGGGGGVLWQRWRWRCVGVGRSVVTMDMW
nr:hypothetical protein [Tanacetum cinerariifolium]